MSQLIFEWGFGNVSRVKLPGDQLVGSILLVLLAGFFKYIYWGRIYAITKQ